MDIANISRLMEEAYTAIRAWSRSVDVEYRRNQQNIQDGYQRVVAFYQKVAEVVPVNDLRRYH
ncbi:hypothetical protein E4U52_000193 [Claviceps spartinae]|nr:hypothetical protein E4U52_000193 [Claviceps spartinae]